MSGPEVSRGRQVVLDGHARALRIITRGLADDWTGAGEEVAECEQPADLAAATVVLSFLMVQFINSTAATYALFGSGEPMTGAELWASLATQVQDPPPGEWNWDVEPVDPSWWRRMLGWLGNG